MVLLTCPCAFALRRLAQSVLPGLGIGFPPLCSHMCALICVLSYVCCHMYSLIHVLSHLCSLMCALICMLSYMCSRMYALLYSLLCALICVLPYVLSYVCSHDAVSLSQFHPQHCSGSLAGIVFIPAHPLAFDQYMNTHKSTNQEINHSNGPA